MQPLRARLTSTKQADIDHKNLKVYICTWNVNSKQPAFELENLLKWTQGSPDLAVFGFQEVSSNPLQRVFDYFFHDPWTNKLTTLLSKLGFVRIKSTRLVGILLNVFVKRELLTHVRYSFDSWFRLGYLGLWGNKGANVCTLNIGGFNLGFINTHLSAHEHQTSKRMLEYTSVIENLFTDSRDSSDRNDGRMSYKEEIEGLPIDRVKEFIEKKEYQKLFGYDQLQKSISKYECFSNLRESPIEFAPTYKFDPDTDTYDTSSKRRVPSWCDRILNQQSSDADTVECEQLFYDHIPCFNQSDHKPVCAMFNVKVKNFDYKAAAPDVLFSDTAQTSGRVEFKYQINSNVVTHSYDWIGLYQANFKSVDDYVTYLYAPERIVQFENKRLKKDVLDTNTDLNTVSKKAALDMKYIAESGTYVLGYFSYISQQLVGLSEEFEVVTKSDLS